MMAQKRTRRGRLILLSVVTCWLFLAGRIALGQRPKWEIGDCWKVGVTLYSQNWLLSFDDPELEARKNVPSVLNRYLVDVRVAAIDIIDGTECWRVEYVPDPNSHAVIREQRYAVWVSLNDGSMRRARRMGRERTKPHELSVDQIGGIPIVEMDGLGFPLEVVYPGAHDASKTKGREAKGRVTVDVSVLSRSGTTEIAWAVRRGVDEFTTSQSWATGARWWNKCERHRQGHIVVKASTLGPRLATEFNSLYQEWRDLNSRGESELAHATYAQMEGIGIAAIPYMMERIEDGDVALIPAVAGLLGGQLKDDASRAETMAWWEISKERWMAPFPPDEPRRPENGSTERREGPSQPSN